MKNRKGPVIYIIDKNSSYRKVIEGFIRVLGNCRVSSSESCERLLSDNIRPDIIILDHNMGENKLSGLDFVRSYGSRFPKTRFIFLSSCTNLEIAVASIKAGACDYIVKSKAGIERMIKNLENLFDSYQMVHREKRQLRTAVISLGMFSLFFALIIFLYNHQVI